MLPSVSAKRAIPTSRNWNHSPVGLGILLSVAAAGLTAATVHAQSAALTETLRQEFVQHAFAVKSFGPARWLNGGQAYTTLENSSASQGATDLVRYDTATGTREVLVSASQLAPPGAKEALKMEDYAWSGDLNRLLIFTNSKRVWRANTRGDYWVLDRRSGTLRKLGDGGPPSSLMFAKFSPDASKVAYVRFNNIYVEDVQTGVITRLTSDGSEKIINGTSDWVYEEEFSVRDAFRWSPDGTRIAYWQFNTTDVKNFALLYDTGSPYNVVTHIPYPEFGLYPTGGQISVPQAGTEDFSARI